MAATAYSKLPDVAKVAVETVRFLDRHPWAAFPILFIYSLVFSAYLLCERPVVGVKPSRSRLLGRPPEAEGTRGRAMTERRGAEAKQSCCSMTAHLQGSPPPLGSQAFACTPNFTALRKALEEVK